MCFPPSFSSFGQAVTENIFTAVFALKIFSPTCLKAKFRNIFYLFKQKSFIIFTCPNQVLLAAGK
jgi:hypothetical protein